MRAQIFNASRRMAAWLLITGFTIIFVRDAYGAEEASGGTGPKQAETNSPEQLLRSNLQLQEQIHGLQLSIETNREESQAAAARNAQALADRLQALERRLADERARDVDAVQSSNRMLRIVATTFGVIGLLAMLLMAYQWRTVGRLAEASTGLSSGHLLSGGSTRAAIGSGELPLLGTGRVDESNARLLDAIDRLEKRILGLEHTSTPVLAGENSTENSLGHEASQATGPASQQGAEPTDSPNGARVSSLLGKGQSLLNLDKPEEALVAFDEALALEPRHTGALLNKAVALEKMRKLQEALDCYDEAIAANQSLTIAYLHKGGLFNRMERYDEALQCYEQALRAQEKPAA